MSSTKFLICDICVVVFIGLIYVSAEDMQKPLDEGPQGNCSCGGFPSPTPDKNSPPLLSQSPGLVIVCNSEGEATCMNLCVALAMATKAKGPEILCSRLRDCDELKLSAFYKACDKPWLYANMTAEQPLCCEKSQVKTCASTLRPVTEVEQATISQNSTTLNPVDATTII